MRLPTPALLLQLLRLAREQGNALTLRPSRLDPTSVWVFQKNSPKKAPYKVWVDVVERNGTEAVDCAADDKREEVGVKCEGMFVRNSFGNVLMYICTYLHM